MQVNEASSSNVTSVSYGRICKVPDNNMFQIVFLFKRSQEMQRNGKHIEKGQIWGLKFIGAYRVPSKFLANCHRQLKLEDIMDTLSSLNTICEL